MGSGGAFERRMFELKLLNKDKPITDEDVFNSYRDEAKSTGNTDYGYPSNFMYQYIKQGHLI